MLRGRERLSSSRWLLVAFGLVSGVRFVLLPIVPLSQVSVTEKRTLVGPSSGFSRGPRYVEESLPGSDEPDIDEEYPSLGWHLFDGAFVEGSSAGVIHGGRHVVSDWTFGLLDDSRLKGISLIAHGQRESVHHLPRKVPEIREGVLVAGYHSHNWYHWMAEILPTVSLLREAPEPLDSMPLLVPEHVTRQPTFREALEALSEHREVIPLPTATVAHVQKLAVVEAPVRCLPGFADGTPPSTKFDRWHYDAMQSYRRLLRERLGVSEGVRPGLRIFIDRIHDPERNYNRDAVLETVHKYGFSRFTGWDQSLREQAQLFAQAEVIVGPSGAGWTNIIFSDARAKALCWMTRGGEGGAWFRNLAHLSGADLKYLVVKNMSPEAFGGNPIKADYHVPLSALESALDSMLSQSE